MWDIDHLPTDQPVKLKYSKRNQAGRDTPAHQGYEPCVVGMGNALPQKGQGLVLPASCVGLVIKRKGRALFFPLRCLG